jgi:predicted glutamine amidotransferase
MHKSIPVAVLFCALLISGFVDTRLDPGSESDRGMRQMVRQSSGEQGGNHNCRLWASISNGLADGILYDQLVVYPYSFKHLSLYNNIDGWGIASYSDFGDSASIERGALRAYADFRFDTVVTEIDTTNCKIVLAHIRQCSAGCCCHNCGTIPDPHPFWRFKNGKCWTFEHNGLADKGPLYELIGPDYLALNPLTGSGIPACDPSDTSQVIDSELYFLLLLKHIEENGWNATLGIRGALVELLYVEPAAALNFVMSDGQDLWAFCKGHSLFYLSDSTANFKAVASLYTTYEQDWQSISDYQLLVLHAAGPTEIIDLRAYLPPVVNCPGDSTVYFFPAHTICIRGFDYSDPDNNIDTVIVQGGTLDSVAVCFPGTAGLHTIVLRVFDRLGGAAQCSTNVMAVETEPAWVRGTVTGDDGNPRSEIEVSILGFPLGDTTDASGHFAIDSLIPGSLDFMLHHRGYRDTTVADVVIAPLDTAILNISYVIHCAYRPGDSNGDGKFDGLDVGFSLNYLKDLGPAPRLDCPCPPQGIIYAAADGNGNCVFNGIDVSYCVNYLKGMGAAPQACGDCPGAR